MCVCVCLFVLVCQLHWLLLVDFRSGKCVCVYVCLFPYVSYTGSLLVDFGSGKCVLVCLFSYVSYTGSLLVDFGSGKCVFVCSRMSVTLVLC